MKSLRESFEGYGGAAKSACPLYVLVCDFLLQRNEKSAFSPSFSSFFMRNLKIPPPVLFFHSQILLFPCLFPHAIHCKTPAAAVRKTRAAYVAPWIHGVVRQCL